MSLNVCVCAVYSMRHAETGWQTANLELEARHLFDAPHRCTESFSHQPGRAEAVSVKGDQASNISILSEDENSVR